MDVSKTGSKKLVCGTSCDKYAWDFRNTLCIFLCKEKTNIPRPAILEKITFAFKPQLLLEK